jgi:hypothetical protein
MRAGRPAHPGCTWFSVLGSWFSVRDARAPRMHVVLGSRFLVLGSGRPRSQGARGSRFLVLGSRFGTPALPGTLSAVAPQGLPRAQRGLQPAVSACGRGRPRTQDARGSQFLVLGSRFGTPALPGGTWFSVLGSWFSVRDARAPRGHVVLGSRFLVLGSWFLVPGSWFLVPGSRFGTPAHPGTLSAVAPQGLPRAQRGLQPAVSSLPPHPFATCSRRNCANTIRPVWV